jgi:hypothetical protein
MEDILRRWQRDEGARAAWDIFIDSPEFERGLAALEAHAIPSIVMEESLEMTAKRQSFQAGFHAALHLIKRLPNLHYKQVQEQLPEWEHIQPEELNE